MFARTSRRSKVLRGVLADFKKRLRNTPPRGFRGNCRADYFLMALKESLRSTKRKMLRAPVPYPLKKEKAPSSLPPEMAILRTFSLQTTAMPIGDLPRGLKGKQIVIIDTSPSASGMPLSSIATDIGAYFPEEKTLIQTLGRYDCPFALPFYFEPGDALAVQGILATYTIASHVLDAVLSKEEEKEEKSPPRHPLRKQSKNKYGETMRLRTEGTTRRPPVVRDYVDEDGSSLLRKLKRHTKKSKYYE